MTTNVVTVAREKEQQLPRRSSLPAVLPVAMAIVSSVSLLLLIQTSGMTTTGYDNRRLEQEREDWQQANYQLEAERAYLQSLARVERDATGRLHMIPATDYVFVSVADSPSPPGDSIFPLVRVAIPTANRDDGWSQRLLDWLGSAMGLGDR